MRFNVPHFDAPDRPRLPALRAALAAGLTASLWFLSGTAHGQGGEDGVWVNLGLKDENVKAVGLSRTNSNLMFAGTNEGRRGIFKTVDGGKTWLPFNNGLGELDFTDMAVDFKGGDGKKADEVVYAISTFTRHVWKTSDGGVTWRNRLTGSSCGNSQLAMDPGDPTRIYVSNCDGVRRTADAAATSPWALVGPASVTSPRIAIARSNPAVVYFAKNQTIYKSANNGTTTAALPALVGPEEQVGLRYIINELVVHPTNESIVYVGTDDNGVYKTTDGGQTWFAINHTLPNQGQGFNVALMAIDPKDGNVVYIYSLGLSATTVDPVSPVTSGFFRTRDGGTTWEPINANLSPDLTVNALMTPDTGGREPLLGTFEGIWRYSPVRAADGDLVKSSADPVQGDTVYKIEGGVKRAFAGMDALASCGFTGETIKSIPTWYLDTFQEGAAIGPCPAAADHLVPGGRFYTQASPRTGQGYSVIDAEDVAMFTAYQQLGGPAGLGFPISRRFRDGPFVMQAFQRGVLQWNPVSRTGHLLNLLDELSLKGFDTWLLANRQVPASADWSADRGLAAASVWARHLVLLERNALIGDRFLANALWLQDFGLPMAYGEVGSKRVLRTQRAVFVEEGGVVTRLNAGDIAKEAGFIPAQAAEPE